MKWRTHYLPIAALLALVTGCRAKPSEPRDAFTDAPASASPASSVAVAAPPAPKTPAELLQEHRNEMTTAAENGEYVTVCKGTPWVNATVCTWVATRATGKSVNHPDGELFHGYFVKEHWKHVYGRIVSDADADGSYEVSVGGYTHHCMLDTDETKYSSKGAFNLWVQEQPETREVTVNSGATQQWVVLEEATLAKMLLDLAKSSSGVEGTAMAKNAMALIARYEPYAERKGELPTLPSSPVDAGNTPPPAPSAKPVQSAPIGAPSVPVPSHAPSVPAVPGVRPVTPPPPAPPAANSNVAHIQQCCSAMHAGLSQFSAPRDVKRMTAAAAGCDLAAVQAAGGSTPDFGSVRRLVHSRPLPPACSGVF
jgi:hypothetical protein